MLLRLCRFRRHHRDHLEGIGLLVVILDRDVLAFSEAVLVKAITSLLITGTFVVIIDHPGCAAGSARVMDQNAVPLPLMGPESANPAIGLFVRPLLLAQRPLRIEGRGDLVGMARAALWKLLAAGQMKRGPSPDSGASQANLAIVAKLRGTAPDGLDPDQIRPKRKGGRLTLWSRFSTPP
jgi:hypothetical protein